MIPILAYNVRVIAATGLRYDRSGSGCEELTSSNSDSPTSIAPTKIPTTLVGTAEQRQGHAYFEYLRLMDKIRRGRVDQHKVSFSRSGGVQS